MRGTGFVLIALVLAAALCISAVSAADLKLFDKITSIVKKADVIRRRLDGEEVLSENNVNKSLKDLNILIKKAQAIKNILVEEQNVLADGPVYPEEEVQSDSMIAAGVTLQATTAVNVRSGACTSFGVKRTLNAGETVKSTGWSGSDCGHLWIGVSGSFGYGYVSSLYVKEVGGPSPPTPSPPSPSGSLTVDQLRRVMPNLSVGKANEYIGHLNNAMSWASITTCLRKSAFLAQLAHESAQLYYFEEIASGDAYEGRKDLGNIYPGDGRRYKGRGPIQLTGRANYRAAGRDLGVDLEGNPTLAATAQWGFKVAGWYWKTRSLNQFADQGTQGGFDEVTRRINGGYNGKADRDNYWRRARSVLGC